MISRLPARGTWSERHLRRDDLVARERVPDDAIEPVSPAPHRTIALHGAGVLPARGDLDDSAGDRDDRARDVVEGDQASACEGVRGSVLEVLASARSSRGSSSEVTRAPHAATLVHKRTTARDRGMLDSMAMMCRCFNVSLHICMRLLILLTIRVTDSETIDVHAAFVTNHPRGTRGRFVTATPAPRSSRPRGPCPATGRATDWS